MMQGESKECNDRSPLSGRPIEVLLQPRVKNAPAAITGTYVLHSHESYRSGRPDDIEDDPAVLERREKQIRYGKNTPDYDAYVKAVPKHRRERHMPRTPEKRGKFSRRRWDGMIKAWKKSIHKYGQPQDSGQPEPKVRLVANPFNSTNLRQPQDAAAETNDSSNSSTGTRPEECSSSERPTKIVGWFWADQVEDTKKREEGSKQSSSKGTDSKPRQMPLKSYEYKARFAQKYNPSAFF